MHEEHFLCRYDACHPEGLTTSSLVHALTRGVVTYPFEGCHSSFSGRLRYLASLGKNTVHVIFFAATNYLYTELLNCLLRLPCQGEPAQFAQSFASQ